MLLTGYRKEMFRPECNPRFQSLHCFLHLDQNIGPVLPYLNEKLGGSGYIAEPPSLLLKIHGRLIGLHSRKIAINALKDETEADRIAAWLMEEINTTWDNRETITPCYTVPPKPLAIEVIKLLPRTNCGECGEATCLVFAALTIDGVKGAADCPPISAVNKKKLTAYLARFRFEP
jgi:ArsR family metal-binding transcriptional regulator